MTTDELAEIKARYDRMVALAESQSEPGVGLAACALAYSFDVPRLIDEVEALNEELRASAR